MLSCPMKGLNACESFKGIFEDVSLRIDDVDFMKLEPLLGEISNKTLGS